MNFMFYGCSGLTSLDVTNFNTSNVTDMGYMFCDCSGLTSLDVSNFNTSNVTDMGYMFCGCSGLTSLDVASFNTSNVDNMLDMFYGCYGLTSLDVSSFNTSNVTVMGAMFYGCHGLTSLDVSKFNTSNVKNMRYMFRYCSGLTSLDVSSFNTSNVTNMYGMFDGCRRLTSLDISSFNTSNVTNMEYMFSYCSKLKTIYAGNEWSTKNVQEGGSIFDGCNKLVGGAGTRYDSNHTGLDYAHIDGGNLNPGYLTSIDDKSSFDIYYEGNFIEGNSVVEIKAEEDSWGFGELNCETNPSSNPKNGLILKTPNGNQSGSAKLEILSNTLNPGMIQWCMGGECIPMNDKTSYEKTFNTDSDGIVLVQFDANNIRSVGELNAKLTATIGSDTKTVNIKFVCDKTSGISIIYSDDYNASWYDMNGSRLENAPTRKGVYIRNGKKIAR